MTFRNIGNPRFNAIFRLIDTMTDAHSAFARALPLSNRRTRHILIVEEDEWDKFLEVLDRQLKRKTNATERARTS